MLLYMLLEPTDCVHIDQKFSPDTVDKNTFEKKGNTFRKNIRYTLLYRTKCDNIKAKKKKKKEKTM